MSKRSKQTPVPFPPPRVSVARSAGYTPGEQPRQGEKIIKLNTNENPYPPSPHVAEAILSFDFASLRRYPSPMADKFREAAAQLYGLSPAQVLAGNGSDDILNIVLRAYLDAGDVLAYPTPSYSLYSVLAEIHGVRVAPVPWGPNWSLPAEKLATTGARVVFITNPNAPSGTVVPTETLRKFAQSFGGLILIDEAYVEFADENGLSLLSDCPNVLLSRTLSKSYSLAGLRFGYVLGAAQVIDELSKVKDSYNCDALAIAAATAALKDQPYARSTWARVKTERTRMVAELTGRGFDVIPSQTNFLFVRPPKADGGSLYAHLKQKGILVRHFDKPGLSDRIRISIGTHEENTDLLAALPG
jgi:histidinol-phosphate aminotransferase